MTIDQLYSYISQNMATKQDLSKVQKDINSLKKEMEAVKVDLAETKVKNKLK